MRSQFTFYESFWKSIKRLRRKEDRLSALEAIIAYALEGEERPMTAEAEGIFILVKPNLDTAARRSENGKKGGKQNGSKTEANAKQNGSKNKGENKKEKEIEVEIEKEYELENDSSLNPPLSPFGETQPFSGELQKVFQDWLAYKAEKRQKYKPTGLKALIGEIRNNADRYGEDAVAELIRESMAANWQGIAFDRLGRSEKNGRIQRAPGADRRKGAGRDWGIAPAVDGRKGPDSE